MTAGASAPEVLAQAVIARLRELGVRNVRALDGIEENDFVSVAARTGSAGLTIR